MCYMHAHARRMHARIHTHITVKHDLRILLVWSFHDCSHLEAVVKYSHNKVQDISSPVILVFDINNMTPVTPPLDTYLLATKGLC